MVGYGSIAVEVILLAAADLPDALHEHENAHAHQRQRCDAEQQPRPQRERGHDRQQDEKARVVQQQQRRDNDRRGKTAAVLIWLQQAHLPSNPQYTTLHPRTQSPAALNCFMTLPAMCVQLLRVQSSAADTIACRADGLCGAPLMYAQSPRIWSSAACHRRAVRKRPSGRNPRKEGSPLDAAIDRRNGYCGKSPILLGDSTMKQGEEDHQKMRWQKPPHFPYSLFVFNKSRFAGQR